MRVGPMTTADCDHEFRTLREETDEWECDFGCGVIAPGERASLEDPWPIPTLKGPSMDEATALTEKIRTYDFGAHSVTLHNVTELVVRPSGTHRVKTADGNLHVIASGWLAIHIDDGGKDWTV